MMLSRYVASPFTNPASVEAWDAWFRWRERGRLRDTSIEATWQRVATALASFEAADPARWSRHFFNAQSSWQLLIDERILANAGTSCTEWPRDPVALLNAACFVADPLTAKAHFDFDTFRDTSELALRAVDNVLLARVRTNHGPHQPRIGLVGMADAIALLGKRFDCSSGRVLAGAIARTLAEGCLHANIRLARDRGQLCDPDGMPLAAARLRGMPRELLQDMQRRGVRHARPTAITSQSRLALFANNVSDALDPLAGTEARSIEADTNTRASHPPGYAFALAQRIGCDGSTTAVLNESTELSIAAQIDLRGAVQPWIDSPIEYPFRVTHEPDGRAATHWQRLAAAYRLGNPRWSHA